MIFCAGGKPFSWAAAEASLIRVRMMVLHDRDIQRSHVLHGRRAGGNVPAVCHPWPAYMRNDSPIW